jgi:ribose transport system permease protein
MKPGVRIAGMLALLAVLLAVGQAVLPGFIGPSQIGNQLKIAAFLGLFGLCQTIVMTAGGQGLDLSVGAVATLGGVIGTAVLGAAGGSTPLAMLCAAVAGLAAGLCNGIGVALMGIPPLVATLAVASVIDGGLILGVSSLHPANAASPALVTLSGLTSGGVPNIVVLWIAVAAVAFWFLRSGWGRRLCATGANPVTAYLSGTDTTRVRMVAYTLSGGLAGFAGILLTGYVSQAFLGLGNPYILTSVVVAAIGGVALEGGRAPYAGVICAAVILTVLISLLTALQMAEAGRQIVLGLTLLAFLLLDRVLKRA